MAVEVCDEIALASPKSATLICPRSLIKTFSGLTSRWTSPASWAAARAASTGSISSSALLGAIGASRLSTSRRVCPCDVLHHDVGPAVGPLEVLTLVENRDHVRMRELGRGSRLAIELAGELGVVTEPDVHDLDGDGTRQASVDGSIDRGHAATGQALRDLVATVQKTTHQRVANGRHRHVCSIHGGEGGRAGLRAEFRSHLVLP